VNIDNQKIKKIFQKKKSVDERYAAETNLRCVKSSRIYMPNYF